MHRILKPTGSIYLHCDPTMSHYLKLVMDAIFGRTAFRNEIVWERTIGRSDAKRFARVHDILLYFGRESNPKWNGFWIPLSEEQIARDYRYTDSHGKFQPTSLTTQGLSGGGYYYEFCGHNGPWRYSEEKMLELERNGRIWLPKKMGGWPRYKRYLSESKGIAARDVITDVPIAPKNERTGYRTQKPLALLRRVIAASSNEGDMVLDPFCGCATACIAAEDLGREWVGIDIGPKAADLVQYRMEKEMPLHTRRVVARTDIPRRTDLGDLPSYKTHKTALYGEQGGHCNGCRTHFKMPNLTVDHIIPRSKGGTDHIGNLQLLCGHCNSVKGDRGMDYLMTKLAA